MINDIIKDAGVRMGKSVESLRQSLVKVRTGRAHPSLLDHLVVDYYGSEVPISQVANVNVEDARTLMISCSPIVHCYLILKYWSRSRDKSWSPSKTL